MANKRYYVEDNGEKDFVRSNFVEKMHKAGYALIYATLLSDNSYLAVYDINETGTLFKTNMREGFAKEFGVGNVHMFGKLENIAQTKKEIEEKTGFVLEEIK